MTFGVGGFYRRGGLPTFCDMMIDAPVGLRNVALWLLCGGLLAFWSSPLSAEAERTDQAIKVSDCDLSAALCAEGWRLLKVPGKASARFTSLEDGVIGVTADGAVGFLYMMLSPETAKGSRLSWSWRVDRAVPDTDLTEIGTDDRSLAIHLCFPADTRDETFWQRVGRSITATFAEPLAGKVLTYVWGGSAPRGSRLVNPHLGGDGALIVLRPGTTATGQWLMEEVDYVADFRAAFGYDPPQPTFLAISSDSDDSVSRSEGAVHRFGFSG